MKFHLTKDPRKLWHRYVLGFSLIACFLVSGHFIHLQTLRLGAEDAAIVDKSGRQRMLSQRLSGLAQRVQGSDDRQKHMDALIDGIKLFSMSHQELLLNAESFPDAMAIYAPGEPDGLDAQTRAFIDDLTTVMALPLGHQDLLAAMERIENASFEPLLASLDAAVKAFSAGAEIRIRELQTYQNLTLGLALLLLMVEGLFIFYPAQKAVQRALDDYEGRTRELKSRNLELAALSEKLAHSALHDQLTGLANRKKLHSELTLRLNDKALENSSLCVMHVDLDRFKEINDTLGHAAGDTVLKRAAEAMQARLKSTDLLARVGGDEFVALVQMKASNVDAAQTLADGIISRVRAPMTIDGNSCSVGASIGYTFASSSTNSAEKLIGDADIALYAAKAAGKGVGIRFDESMRSGIERRHALLQDLERALYGDEFVPYLQPLISFKTGEVVGFEVLARWLHPERGLLPPADFIPLAEEAGLGATIDRQVMLLGIDAISEMHAQGWPDLTISVNASPDTLRNPETVDDMIFSAGIRGVNPSHIRIEVLESTLISHDGDLAVETIHKLSDAGCKIDVDDFGTGFASLSMLAKINLSGLKIARELVDDLSSQKSLQIVEAVVGLAKGLHLEVVAEGIETEKQFAELDLLGCDIAQGFAIGKPMSVTDTRSWLEQYGSAPSALKN